VGLVGLEGVEVAPVPVPVREMGLWELEPVELVEDPAVS